VARDTSSNGQISLQPFASGVCAVSFYFYKFKKDSYVIRSFFLAVHIGYRRALSTQAWNTVTSFSYGVAVAEAMHHYMLAAEKGLRGACGQMPSLDIQDKPLTRVCKNRPSKPCGRCHKYKGASGQGRRLNGRRGGEPNVDPAPGGSGYPSL